MLHPQQSSAQGAGGRSGGNPAGNPAKAAITELNYTFLVLNSGDEGIVTVRIEPRRRDVLLVSGFISLTHDDGDLVQMQAGSRKARLSDTHGRRDQTLRPPQWRPRADAHGVPPTCELRANPISS